MRLLAGSFLPIALLPSLSFGTPTTTSLFTIPLQRQTQPALLYLNFAEDDSPDMSDPHNAAVANQQVQVVTAIETGDGQTFPNMLVDTGSAFLWVDAGQTKYSPGPHSHRTNYTFDVGYGDGSASGDVYVDQVVIGSATVAHQYVGAATNVSTFSSLVNFDGILGLGRNIGNNGSIPGKQVTPTFVDSLRSEGRIQARTIGVYLAAYDGNGTETDAGEITFGGVDRGKFLGDLAWAPQKMDNPHWAIQIDSVSYGTMSLPNSTSEAIVDTGTLPILLPFHAFFGLSQLLNGTINNSGPLAGWLAVPPNITLESLTLSIASANFTIPPEAYLMPESLYAHYNVTGPQRQTWFASGGFGNAALGQKFLELYYSVYDSDNERIGFAPTTEGAGMKVSCGMGMESNVIPSCT
ncbi:acid protease [Calocera viscosa TUFC12733]|uniref:Acid protease n=1 Tax=Calocera viscosa (strain TUFC12733) TaxID=1330018 RepID=A0A167PIJ6_CALVF|nr:acid protease [Calocera viscosa TUFC12733]